MMLSARLPQKLLQAFVLSPDAAQREAVRC